MINSEVKKHKFLTSRPIKKTSHFFATSTSFKLEAYENIAAEKRPIEKFKKVVSGSIYDYKGKLIKHAELNYKHGSKYICPLNENSLPSEEKFSVVRDFFTAEKKLIKGKTLYIGNWMGHYGHFIIENLSRLWDLDNLKNYKNLAAHPFIFDKQTVKVHPYQSYFLELLGIECKRVLPLYKSERLLSVDIPEQAWLIAGPVNIEAKKIYEKIHTIHNNKKKYKKIFISRYQNDSSRTRNINY